MAKLPIMPTDNAEPDDRPVPAEEQPDPETTGVPATPRTSSTRDGAVRSRILPKVLTVTLKVISLVTAVVVIAALLLVWRLNLGPVKLDFVRPWLLEALQSDDPPLEVGIGAPVLTWRGWSGLFDVSVSDIRLSDPANGFAMQAPNAGFRLSVKALFDGVAAPVRIRIDQPNITIAAAEPSAGGDRVATTTALFATLADVLDGNPALSGLREIDVRGGTVTIPAEPPLQISEIRGLDATVSRQNGLFKARLTAQPIIDGHPTALKTNLDYMVSQDRVTGTIDVDGLALNRLTGALPQIADRLSLSGMVNGHADFEFTSSSGITRASIALDSGAGKFSISELGLKDITFDSFVLQANYDATIEKLDIPIFEIRRNGTHATTSVEASSIFNDASIVINAVVTDLPGNDIETFWPETRSKGARSWATKNLAGGTVTSATLRIGGTHAQGSDGSLEVTTLQGTIDYRDVTVHYLRPLPPATDVAGRASFGLDRFDIAITSARLDDLRVTEGQVTLVGFTDAVPQAKINFRLQGPVTTALTVLDHEGLRLIDRVDLDPTAISGQIAGTVRISFPLVAHLRKAGVAFAAEVTLDRVESPDAAFGLPLAAGRFDLAIDRDGMRIRGDGRLGGLPASLTLIEDFSGKAELRRERRLKISLDPPTARHLGLPAAVALDGAVYVDTTVRDMADGRTEVSAVLDLAEAGIGLGALQWQKRLGTAGHVHFILDLKDQRPIRLRSASIIAGDLVADLHGIFDASGERLQTTTLTRLVLGDTTISGTITSTPDSYTANLAGSRLDLRPFMASEHGERLPTIPATTVSGGFDVIMIQGLPPIQQAVLSFRHTDADGKDLQISGLVEGRAVTIGYRQDSEGERNFEIRADDAGSFLKAGDFASTVLGGRLAISGQTPAVERDPPTRIFVTLEDFGISDAPALARLLDAAFLPSLVDKLSGKEGIHFNRLKAEANVTSQQIDIRDAFAYGNSFGVSAEGSIERKSRRLDISGLTIPAYVLSQLIDHIPVIGRLLTGGKEEGIIASEYRAVGTLDNPSVTVNPITALAPGFLRSILSALTTNTGGDPETAGANPGRRDP